LTVLFNQAIGDVCAWAISPKMEKLVNPWLDMIGENGYITEDRTEDPQPEYFMKIFERHFYFLLKQIVIRNFCESFKVTLCPESFLF
jgi:hypothetical protein